MCALDCRSWIWRPQVKIIYLGGQCEITAVFSMEKSLCAWSGIQLQVCSRRENAAVVLPAHASLCTERDPSVLVACERSSLSHEHRGVRTQQSVFDGTCLFAHGARSKCAPGVRRRQSFRRNMSLCARSEIQVCSMRANAAVLSHEQLFLLRTERDPSVLAAWERSSLFAGTCLFAHGERSKCAHSVRKQQCCRMNMSVCARKEIQVCSRRGNASVFLPEHVFVRSERDPSGVRAHQSCRMNISLCLVRGWRSKWRDFACARAAVALMS